MSSPTDDGDNPFAPPPRERWAGGARDASGDDAGMRLLLPVGRSGWAISSGYLGLISVLLLPAPLALVTGILAVVEIRKNPKKHGMGRAIFGIVMGTIFTVPLVILAFVWATVGFGG